ncbi:hypothetical protein [Gordonia neofelifaecis]|uniref:Uncharacterized protein n=1 Tax=Gordonia neofelifaecis NRRL B-59395 TaxID=644548 RepID=F1YE08_9ACTN|nr:hypothetical protein [Gordonia neofelifaecis]EGD57098.1 hypothetical protein SCNU_01950 [Gordonia neofelifaecis NRRL B-59395]
MAGTQDLVVDRRTASPRKRSSSRVVWLAVAGWLVINAVLIALAGEHLPLHASELAEPPTVDKVIGTDLMYLEVFALMVVVHLLTRHRKVPDLATRAPERTRTGAEVAAMLGYGSAGMVGGFLLGRAFGWHAFSFHLDGMVIRTDQPVTIPETLSWAVYNLIVFAIVPLIVFRRGYTTEQLSLRSSDRRADLLLIVVVLAIESAVQLAVAGSSSILGLPLRQALLGAPLTLVLGLAGTALPTMIFIYCILTPRYLRLTGSVPATVVLGGLTYATLHFFDGWTNFASPTDALISVLYLFLFYTGPGMFKTFITIRSANAWTHLWAYHAIAPHTLLDTPMFVKVFGVR